MAQINKSSDYFNSVLYTGNGSTQSITGVGYQPDFVWLKNRNSTNEHCLTDVVRGATKYLHSNLTQSETTAANSLTSFDSDGFSLGSNANFNTNTNTYVAWNWLADNTSGSSNTDGSITSTVSANTTAGFSIVSYTGTGSAATVGHGLGVAPSMLIVKNRGAVGDWRCYHKSLGNTQLIRLNLTNATLTNASWNNTTPTSTVFSIGVNDDVNQNGGTHIAYCFAEKKGFSKFGSYTGNGSTDGPFIYTGFKPAWIMIKVYNNTVDNWYIQDSKRLGYNFQNPDLRANATNAENLPGYADMLSNGFKIRDNGDGNNTSGYGYIYMAFAESPLVGTNNIPATAR